MASKQHRVTAVYCFVSARPLLFLVRLWLAPLEHYGVLQKKLKRDRTTFTNISISTIVA